MLQLPGVTEMYELSEAMHIVAQLIDLYKLLFEVVSEVSVLNKNVAMANFVTQMHMPVNSSLDLATVSYDVKADRGIAF